MIELIHQMLQLGDLYNVSERVDIAKGKYELTTSFKKTWKQRKRK